MGEMSAVRSGPEGRIPASRFTAYRLIEFNVRVEGASR